MKHNTILTMALYSALLLGTALFGGGTARASSGVMAAPSTQTIYVDGQRVNMTAYSIGGSNFVKLRDVGKAVGFAVSYDAASRSVRIDSGAPYMEESQIPAAPSASAAPAGAISVPQTDEAPFVPKEGDVILCDAGTTYTKPKCVISRMEPATVCLSETSMRPAGCNILSTTQSARTARPGGMENWFCAATEALWRGCSWVLRKAYPMSISGPGTRSRLSGILTAVRLVCSRWKRGMCM